jgi:hypothetical protein
MREYYTAGVTKCKGQHVKIVQPGPVHTDKAIREKMETE